MPNSGGKQVPPLRAARSGRDDKFGLGARWCSGAEEEGDEGKQGDQGDEALRDDAVEAPDFEHMGFDVAEVEGEGEGSERQDEGEPALAEEGA